MGICAFFGVGGGGVCPGPWGVGACVCVCALLVFVLAYPKQVSGLLSTSMKIRGSVRETGLPPKQGSFTTNEINKHGNSSESERLSYHQFGPVHRIFDRTIKSKMDSLIESEFFN